MKQTKWICDKCGEEITDVVYSLTCYAQDVTPAALGMVSTEVAAQNMRQNLCSSAEAHLCRKCKNTITDGVFIV